MDVHILQSHRDRLALAVQCRAVAREARRVEQAVNQEAHAVLRDERDVAWKETDFFRKFRFRLTLKVSVTRLILVAAIKVL